MCLVHPVGREAGPQYIRALLSFCGSSNEDENFSTTTYKLLLSLKEYSVKMQVQPGNVEGKGRR